MVISKICVVAFTSILSLSLFGNFYLAYFFIDNAITTSYGKDSDLVAGSALKVSIKLLESEWRGRNVSEIYELLGGTDSLSEIDVTDKTIDGVGVLWVDAIQFSIADGKIIGVK